MTDGVREFRSGLWLGAALLSIAPNLPAAHWRVNDTQDLPATAACPAEPRGRQSTRCTLRGAIQRANEAGGGPHTIAVAPGIYPVTGAPGDDSNETGDLDVNANILIEGAGADKTIVRFAGGPDTDRVFDMRSGYVTLKGLTIEGGHAAFPEMGGGIRIRRNVDRPLEVKVIGCRIGGNAAGGGGGGIYNEGVLMVEDSDVVENATAGRADQASGWGGGILNARDSQLTVLNSRIAANLASGHGASGGGLFNDSVAVLRNTIIRSNRAEIGSGVSNSGRALDIQNSDISYNEGNGTFINLSPPWASPQMVTLTHVTIVHTSPRFLLFHDWADFRIKHSILAGGDCYINIGSIVSEGYNIFTFTSPCYGLQTQPTDRLGVDPQLEAGIPKPGSPAIDAIPPRACSGCPVTDVRGVRRPQLYNRPDLAFTIDTPVYDIGAYEVPGRPRIRPF